MAVEKPFAVIQKSVGQTPLECMENWRKTQEDLANIPLAYAGRLDPMASGSLLVLIGEECKKQTEYHGLDKEYEFSVLFGVSSDSGDVLGLVKEEDMRAIKDDVINSILSKLIGLIELPYPIFSAKTVDGKPLHTWTMEGRLHEITIPTKRSNIFELELISNNVSTREMIAEEALHKIELIPPVTDLRKALGNDFRRPDIRKAWNVFLNNGSQDDQFTIANFRCVCSSGTYMRTLSEVIAKNLNTTGLAYSIHRTKIGHYDQEEHNWNRLFV